jgi:hypothetical protein
MILLKPNEVCPNASDCDYADDKDFGVCFGARAERDGAFICELAPEELSQRGNG